MAHFTISSRVGFKPEVCHPTKMGLIGHSMKMGLMAEPLIPRSGISQTLALSRPLDCLCMLYVLPSKLKAHNLVKPTTLSLFELLRNISMVFGGLLCIQ